MRSNHAHHSRFCRDQSGFVGLVLCRGFPTRPPVLMMGGVVGKGRWVPATDAVRSSSLRAAGGSPNGFGNILPACEVWVDVRKAWDRIIAILQPMNRKL